MAQRHFPLICTLMLLLAPVTACKVSDDAVAASEQMTATAADLSSYYSALAYSVSDTISLSELDESISGIPFSASDKKLSEDIRNEILKREELANALARLAASFASLSGSKAPSDVEAAASSLGNELIQVKALPGGSGIPEAVGKAGNYLLQIIQQHEEKKAARAMDQTVSALKVLFQKEKPTYDSLAKNRIFEASQVAKDLISANGVDASPLLLPALKPFVLTPLPPSQKLQESLKNLALTRLQSAADEASQREIDASNAMLAALEDMNSRIHALATEKRMPVRGNPFSLKVVESWIASAI